MTGRGGGKKHSNRNVIAPGRLQNMIRPGRLNESNTIDSGTLYGKGSTMTKSSFTKRVQNVPSDIDVETITKNLKRQRATFREQEIELQLLNRTNTNIPNPQQVQEEQVEEEKVQEEQVQEEPYIDCESECFVNDDRIEDILGKRKRMTKLASRVATSLQASEVVIPHPKEVNLTHVVEDQARNINVNLSVNEATSNTRARGSRGKYKSYVVDMKIKGKGSKLTIEIPDEINRAIGEMARHLVNECGRIVRTRAPLNVKNWKEALSNAGDSMWKEIQDKFQISDSSCNLKMYNFVIDTMQRLYRLWICRLHYYYKSSKCGKTDLERKNNPPPDIPQAQWEWCVNHYGSDEFKIVSQRNSKNRLSENRFVHTTGNLAFAEVEDMMIKENKSVKPTADVIWLIEHTHTNTEKKLEWADGTRSKIIHDTLKEVVTMAGDSMTQEEVLTQVQKPRFGYVRGKGTALRGYTKGKHQLEQQRLLEKQQGKIQEQDQRIKEQDRKIKELEDIQQKQQQELEETQRKQQEEMTEYKAQQKQAMEDFKREMFEQLANRGVR